MTSPTTSVAFDCSVTTLNDVEAFGPWVAVAVAAGLGCETAVEAAAVVAAGVVTVSVGDVTEPAGIVGAAVAR
jgi:hypothetical protein